MDFRLSRAGAMLSDLLEEELSEAHVGLSTGARAHLDRFRAYIRGFYATRFGRFPPPAADPRYSTIFSPDVYSSMKADFEALYQYLADETYTTTNNAPSGAQGGLCALQSVREFDLCHKFPPLDHPLPHLPEPMKTKESRRRRSMLWFQGSAQSREGKLHPDERLVVHSALMRAANNSKIHLLDNSLVLAYRDFEQDSVMLQRKGERSDKPGVSPSDARKVRWLFIYAMYQAVRSCTDVPREVKDKCNVPYHLVLATKNIPPWRTYEKTRGSTREGRGSTTPRAIERGQSIGAVPLLSSTISTSPQTRGGIEIKPDIDYFALTHQQEEKGPSSRGRSISEGNGATSLPRSRSQSLTRTMSIRRSLSIFRASSQRCASTNFASPSPANRKSVYHEIIVHGYGNGTNSVTEEAPTSSSQHHLPQLSVVTTTTTTPPIASRSASTSSANSYSSALSSPSTIAPSLASTTPTTLVDPTSPTSSRQTSDSWASTTSTVLSAKPSYENLTFPIRTQAAAVRKGIRDMYSNDDMFAAAMRSEPPPLPRRSSKRFLRGAAAASKRWSLVNVSAQLREGVSEGSDDDEGPPALQVSPLRRRMEARARFGAEMILPDGDEDEDDDWEKSTLLFNTKEDVSPPCAWEQYTDLGGLQPLHMLT